MIVLALVLLIASTGCGSALEITPTPEPTPTAVAIASPTPAASPVPTAVTSPPAATAEIPPTVGVASLPSVSDLVERIEPAVVAISVESLTRGLFFEFTDGGAGTGMVVRADGYIVTNYHVVSDASQIKVNMPDGRSYDATLVGRDSLTDLAIVQIDAEDLPTVTFGDSDRVRVGDWVVAVGNALSLRGGPSVTMGIISARGRTANTERGTLYDMIQTDAAINDGNSGGPLVDMQGRVIGINTAMLRQAQGIGFAISSAVAVPIIDALIEKGYVVRPLIGLSGVDLTSAIASQLDLNVAHGIVVTRMSRSGPAYRAGIRVGDVITRIDDIPTSDMTEFLTLLWTYDVGDVIQVEYVNNNKTHVAPVELAERPPS